MLKEAPAKKDDAKSLTQRKTMAKKLT